MNGARAQARVVVALAALPAVACIARTPGASHAAFEPASGASSTATAAARWVGTWACSPQLVEPSNMPPEPGLAGNTLRQVVAVSIGGARLRIRLSNAYGDGALALTAVHVARSAGPSAIEPATDRTLKFAGAVPVTIAPGDTVTSDPIDFALAPLGRLAVTMQFARVPAGLTGHPGSRTTSYLQAGDALATAVLPSAATTDHWYIIAGADVAADEQTAAVVTLGDSITDGRGSTTNGQDRWPDNLARRLQANPTTAKVAVLNHGIGGNAVLGGGLGTPAVKRFREDVLGQPGVRWLIVLHGVNDIGLASSAVADAAAATAADLIAALGRFADEARAAGVRAYASPLLPFAGSQYDSAERQAARRQVNDWIVGGGKFDAVIRLDQAVADPADPTRLLPAYDTGDHLHPNAAGYQRMADAIDLALFAPPPRAISR